MRATVMRRGQLVVDTLPDPTPRDGEALVKTLACGICGSDLHALKHADKMVEAARETGAPFSLDVTRDVVMGHEFCAEVVDYGPNTNGPASPGERVVSMPLLFRDGRIALATGIAFLFCCVLLRELAFSFGSGAVSDIIGEGMLIIGWVAMWRPLEIFLYEWVPVRRRCRILAKLSKMPVIVQPK